MAGSLAGKVCLVTGGTRGIGRGIALQLGGAGATVYVTGRTFQKKQGSFGSLQDTAEEIESRGGRCVPVVCDHSDPEQVRAVFDQIRREQDSRLDILVNNAYAAVTAIFEATGVPFWKQDEAMWDTVNNVGLKNHYLCSIHAARLMVPRKTGLIVNISSPGGLMYLFNVPYGVGKAALDRMAADCAVELRKHDVTVVSLWPGFVQTELVQGIMGPADDVTTDAQGRRNKFKESFVKGETTECAGVCVVRLAQDPHVHNKTGRVLLTGDLASEYGFKDVDGRPVASLRSAPYMLQTAGWKRTAGLMPSWLKLPHSFLALISSKF